MKTVLAHVNIEVDESVTVDDLKNELEIAIEEWFIEQDDPEIALKSYSIPLIEEV